MTRAICAAYAGEARQAERELQRIALLRRGAAHRCAAGAALRRRGGRRAARGQHRVERGRGADPVALRAGARARGRAARGPARRCRRALRHRRRADAGRAAGRSASRRPIAPAARGVLSSAAMVDLYSQLWAEEIDGERARARGDAARGLCRARSGGAAGGDARAVGRSATRTTARQVLTAYAAARLPVDEALLDDAPRIIASMLAAGLDRNAMRWGAAVPEGSEAWALLALAQPERRTQVSGGAVEDFIDDDASDEQRKSRFLVAGLAGLGRLDIGRGERPRRATGRRSRRARARWSQRDRPRGRAAATRRWWRCSPARHAGRQLGQDDRAAPVPHRPRARPRRARAPKRG